MAIKDIHCRTWVNDHHAQHNGVGFCPAPQGCPRHEAVAGFTLQMLDLDGIKHLLLIKKVN